MESHARSATAYVSGPLTSAIAARAIYACNTLPAAVRAVRVDLRGISVWDIDALMMLEVLLLEWGVSRAGVTRIAYPPARARDAFVAVPYTIRDAPDAELRPERDERVASPPPSLIW